MEVVSEIILVVCLGMILGSFTTALAHRVPRGISWGAKRSFCPSCGTVLGVFDLFPLVSWCLNKGKCRYCKTRVSAFYPLVELACMGLCLGVYSFYGLSVSGVFIYAAVPFLLALFLIDVKHMILPNQLIIVLFFLGALRLLYFWIDSDFSNAVGFDILINNVLASLVFTFLSWGTGAFMSRLLKKESLGFGDVKFFGMAGLWLGLEVLPLFMIISGCVAVGLAFVWHCTKKSNVFPFGPALIAAFFILLFYQGIILT